MSYPRLRLLGFFTINFLLENKTGLLIRSGKSKEILGGADIQTMSIEKSYKDEKGNIHTLVVPYIPGSSLKGRARALLELALGLKFSTTDEKIYYHMRVVKDSIEDDDPYCPVDNIFGTASIPPDKVLSNKNAPTRHKTLVEKCWAPTRAIFRDLYPSDKYVQKLIKAKGADFVTFEDFLEEKWENRIDRVTSAADPRNALRVKPGVEFEGEITFLVFDLDVCKRKECDELSQYKFEYPAREYFRYLLEALTLVEETYLGASGTRGYGNVKFRDIEASFYDVIAMKKETLNDEKTKKKNWDTLAEFKQYILSSDIWDRLRKTCQ